MIDFAVPPKASIDPFDLDPVVVPVTELVANPREIAARAAREVFRRFDYDASLDRLRGLQAQLGAR